MDSLAIIDCGKENERVHMLDISRIAPNRRQPRRSFEDRGLVALADSIYRHGMIQPLSVRKISEKEHSFELVAGERRFRAAKLLRMERVPCIIINADEKTSAAMAIIENIQRQDLNIFEEANAISALKEIYGITQEQIAATLSVSQSYVANKLRILRLTQAEQKQVLENNLTERHCRALIRLTGKQRTDALEYIIKNGLNVTSAEAYVDKLLEGRTEKEVKPVTRRLKDMRIFYNSIDRAINTVRGLGVDVISEKTEEEGCTKLLLIIPRNS